MDPILTPTMLTTALTKLLNGIATDAGAKAWDTLKALIARHRGTAPELPASAEDVSTLAGELAAAAEQDAEFAQELRTWQQTVTGSGNVVLNLNAPVKNLINGQDMSGSTFNLS
ncbi:hypothetical protein KGQ20_44610 [Catenulispora sp. NF23]|uniref:Uncharacterized protein n=1 Tax=Catenulispora pinistramenti TaxID=2705254 RepID=A0ABS5L594_9ACTN|nr:hypothetical protein [Catenulispora pinistramenti]MBS2539847.1 hypothetical protein [Catenulispora pinistramenti]MBS2553476.1 hypothetical protein [Catenulispora pinistramenti]